jgi:sulfate adenylyltransferase subunit 2
MDHLDHLENESVYIIREAYKEFRDIAVLWSIGKDSTTLLYLIRKAFFGHVPFPVMHLDTSFKFREIYVFRDRMAKEWHLNLVIAQNCQALTNNIGPGEGNKLTCCGELKTEALKQAIKKYKYRAILLGIRRDEHGIRAKERYFSPRDNQFTWDYKNQPAELWDLYKNTERTDEHIRVHPLLHWTELDIWSYIQREKIPIIDLYLAKNGKRYRSIGCEPCCSPVESDADTVDKIVEELKTTTISERSGRAQDKERAYMMQKLRSMGYM